jgi:3-hydroxyacyl-CoA dehydrogenase
MSSSTASAVRPAISKMHTFRTATVLGAGTMGAQIAAHLANAGVPVTLLDLTREVAAEGLKRAKALKPDPFFTREAASLISVGGFDAHLDAACAADWIVEAVVERLDVKQELFARVEASMGESTIVSSNTSGIPIGALAAGRSPAFARRFLGTHFFNPPRYLKLLEVIPTSDTDPDVLARVSTFADRRLGKGVVVAKDTPNFIANHLGLYGVLRVLDVLERGDFTIDEIDAITGPAIGRPKSATFRTVDLSGIDVLVHVARNLAERVGPERAREFALPHVVEELASRGWIGEKAGQGFYKRERRDGESEILTLDPATMTYRPRVKPQLPALEKAKAIEDVGERVKTLFLGQDRVGEFLRATLGPTLIYAARVAPDISHSLDDMDRAMCWGYGWELGPFETCDAIGLRELVEACRVTEPPPLIAERLAANRTSVRETKRVPPLPGVLLLRDPAGRTRVVKSNPGASLIDLGDGVLGVDLHSKMNAIGGDTISMLSAGVKEASRSFAAMVISTDSPNFSVGANIMLLLLEAQEGNWDEIDVMVRAFQNASMSLRLASVPVVVAPAGMALGGGCEIVLHADRVTAAAETYMGLVEVGVGLIPAGGGTKEMLARATEDLTLTPQSDLLPEVQRVFETIGFAKVSTSARDAQTLGFLKETDRIVMNRDVLVADAKALALARVAEGYQPSIARTSIPVGGAPVEAALKLGVHLAWRAGRISDHDALVGRQLAHVLAGGSLPHPGVVSEQYLLELEREAFLRLCGERKTLERIQHTLKTGKPLRN